MKKWLIAAALISVIGMVGALLTYRQSGIFNSHPWKLERTSGTTNVTRIAIRGDAADIDVRPAAGNRVTMQVKGSGMKPTVHMTSKDGKLTISEREPVNHLQLGWFHYTHILVYLPRHSYQQLTVHSDAGTIHASSFSARSSHFSSDAGNINLSNGIGRIKASSDAGNIKVNSKRLSGDMDIQTDAGNVAVHFTNSPSSVAIDYHSDAGSETVHLPGLTNVTKGDYVFHAVKGSGKYTINVRTDAGNLDVD